MKSLYRLYDAYPLLMWKRRGSAFVGALDEYTSGLAASYSVSRRLLASYTGPLIRVRRSGDNAEYDFFGSGNGDLDTASLTAFCVAGGGTQHGDVTTIYDQSGNGRDFVQATASAQMRIVASGAVYTTDGVVVMRPSATDSQFYATATFGAYAGTDWGAYSAVAFANSGQTRVISFTKDSELDFNATTRACGLISISSTLAAVRANGVSSSIAHSSSLRWVYTQFTSAGWQINDGVNNTTDGSVVTFDTNRFLLGAPDSSTANNTAGNSYSEISMWLSDISSNASAIRSALTA